ncbi:triacylglycerol lipase, partial [Variovorax sp. dw_308]|uniref:esterase/lipase family protein n=1 Tax=Variovorax sp. dw_308 TaxID=2721546 RepID=UPI001C471F6C
MQEGFKLATDLRTHPQQKAEGFATPAQDRAPQIANFAPKRVLPIIFLPGIMGSNLKITDKKRISKIGQKDNKAWRPDDIGGSNARELANTSPRDRQLRLDPATTDVDRYDPTGESNVSGDERHAKVKLTDGFNSPDLTDDPPTKRDSLTAAQKARLRGWGEVYFGSYGQLLELLESRLNNIYVDGTLRAEWRDVVGVDPSIWMADRTLPQNHLTEQELKKAVTGCIFPVYAMGYNWLKPCATNADEISRRISDLIKKYDHDGFECNKVILVTHSMGGLLARALIHPKYGGLESSVLGIVHGVQPAIGAAAAYKRIRAGFEDPGMAHTDPKQIEASVASKIIGNFGDEVTAFLANSPGGLELLPNQEYGNGWLKVTHQDRSHPLASWPRNNDPYSEIYSVKGKWYSLLREEWINPADLDAKMGGGSFSRTIRYLNEVKTFRAEITNIYHPISYAHYGADEQRVAYGNVVWQISRNCVNTAGWESWPITDDTRQGTLDLLRWAEGSEANKAFPARKVSGVAPRPIQARIGPPTEPGDQTVPMRSADHQLKSGR